MENTSTFFQFGWSIKDQYENDIDLDASAFLLNKHGKINTINDFVFYNNKHHLSRAVIHSGKLYNEDDIVREYITVDTELLPKDIEMIALTISFYDSEIKKLNLSDVVNEIVVLSPEIEDCVVEESEIPTTSAMILGYYLRNKTKWEFHPTKEGFAGGLEALLRHFKD